MTQVGKLQAVLGLDSSGFKSGLKSAESDLDSFSGKAATGGKIVGAAMGGIGLAAAGGFIASIKSAADFEHELDAVGAVSNATEKEMKGLTDTALRIGKDTAFSATEAAKAMEELASNGLSATQIMNGAADATVALAAAGGTDLVTAAGVASTAMKVWNLSGEDMIDVVNRVAGAANVSRFGVEDMAGAIAQGAGVAQSSGVSFQDFNTAIAASADLFSSGSDAGTSFKTFMQRLANPTDEAAGLMKKLGFNAYDANGNLRSMADIAGNLQGSMANLTEEQRSQALATLFGSDASRTAIGLMRQGKEGFEAMDKTMRETDAAAVAAKRMGNLNGAIESLKGTIEFLMITLGLKFLPMLTAATLWLSTNLPGAIDKTVAALTPFVEQGTAIAVAIGSVLGPAILGILPTLSQLIETFTGNQAAMEAAGIVLGVVLVAAFVALAVAAGSAAVGVIAATLPFLALAAAVGLLVAGVVLLVQHWDEVVKAFPAAGVALTAVKQEWAQTVEWAKSTLLPLITSIGTTLGDMGAAAETFISDHWDAISGILEAGGKFWVEAVKNALDLIRGIIEGQLKIVAGILDVAMGLLTGDWDRAWKGIKEILDGVWTIISSVVQFQIDSVVNLLTNGLDLLKAAWGLAWDVVSEKLSSIWESMIGNITSAGPNMLSAVTGVVQGALGVFGDWEGHFEQAGMDMIWGVIHGIDAIAGTLLSKAGDLAGSIAEKLNPANWIGSPKGIQKWFPYYLGLGLDGMAAEASRNPGAISAADAIAGATKAGIGDWIDAFKQAPEAAAKAFNSLNQDTRDELATHVTLLKAFKAESITLFEDHSVAVKAWADNVDNTLKDAVAKHKTRTESLQTQWRTGLDLIKKGTVEGLTSWRGALEEGLQKGYEMSDSMIKSMFGNLDTFIRKADLPDTTRTLAEATMQALRDTFNTGGGAANQTLIELINTLIGTASRGAGEVATIMNGISNSPTPTVNPPNGGGAVPPGYYLGPDGALHHMGGAGGAAGGGSAYAIGQLLGDYLVAQIDPAGHPYWFGPDGMARIPGYRWGTNFVPHDGLAYLHRGEAVTPAGSRALANREQPGNGFTVEQNGPVNIYTYDADEGKSAKDDWLYTMGAGFRGKGGL